MTVQPDLVAGRYRLVESAGSGGMGRVWLATDEVLNRRVAVKEVVSPDALGPDEVRDMGARAVREARAAARLNHPNVVTVYDVVVGDTTPWIVMEYVPSRSLSQAVAEDGPMEPAAAARVGLAVLSALQAAHGVGVLHRDVKPGNVLMADDGRVVLTDFGVATILGDPSVTRSGLVFGSPSYLAPERLQENATIGAPADLWSLGATLYFAVEGRPPYQRSGPLATVAALASEDPDPMARAGPLVPVISRLLRRDPTRRPSAPTVYRLLRGVVEPSRRRGPARRPAMVVAPTSIPDEATARSQVPAATTARADVPTPAAAATTAPAEVPTRAAAATTARTVVPRPARSRPARVALALAVLAVLAVVAWTLARPETRPPASSPVGPAPPAGTATVGASPPTSSPPTSAPPTAGFALPAGWRWYTDRTGFKVAVPDDWSVSRRGTIVYFADPGGDRLLGIDQTDRPRPDPVADWAGKESYRVARGDFPSYRRVRLAEVDYFDKAADWEFTYVRDGVRLHVNNRGFITSPTQAYGMWWSTPDGQWRRHLPDLRLIQRSFVPVNDG
jgi:eukaryotic-like serine/threonine-protein kinase